LSEPLPDPIPEGQVTPAHVFELVQKEVVTRLAILEDKVDKLEVASVEAGLLNGNAAMLKAVLAQYSAAVVSKQAWATVRTDLAHRLRFLRPGRHWLTVLLAGALGAVGWQFGSALLGIHLSLP
jgi:hypothetical protein